MTKGYNIPLEFQLLKKAILNREPSEFDKNKFLPYSLKNQIQIVNWNQHVRLRFFPYSHSWYADILV